LRNLIVKKVLNIIQTEDLAELDSKYFFDGSIVVGINLFSEDLFVFLDYCAIFFHILLHLLNGLFEISPQIVGEEISDSY
jgi:hypothetical protein